MSEIELLAKLKKHLVSFLDELIELFPQEKDFVIFRIFVNDQVPITDIMNYITIKLCPLQDMVKSRDENFILNHNILFEKFDQKKSEKVNYFKNLWLSGVLTPHDKEIMWKWLLSFINIGNKYLDIKK